MINEDKEKEVKENSVNEKPIDDDKEVEETSKKEKKENEKKETPQETIASLEVQVKKWQNAYYEAYADMDNLRKQINKDHEKVLKYRAQGFLEALLPAFDNFYNCFKFTPDDQKLAAYCKGFEMIYNQMINALESEGVKEFIPHVGDEFNHENMQAVDVVEGEVDNKVAKVVNKGYYLKDRLVRAANVVVTKAPKKEEKKEGADEPESKDSNSSKAN